MQCLHGFYFVQLERIEISICSFYRFLFHIIGSVEAGVQFVETRSFNWSWRLACVDNEFTFHIYSRRTNISNKSHFHNGKHIAYFKYSISTNSGLSNGLFTVELNAKRISNNENEFFCLTI